MTSLMHLVSDNYNELLDDSKKDPEVDSWPFMSGPLPVCAVLAAYLMFVLKWGPEFMAKRKAFELKSILLAYNLFCVLFNLWLVCKIFTIPGVFVEIARACSDSSTTNPLRNLFSSAAWWYFISKMIEFLDTVFFVLRKKQSQVTFLHVYHHSIMMLFSWGYLKFLPGEQGIFIGTINSFVHVIMYSYYFIAALGPAYQKYIWWKKYMTKIQLTQFVLMLTYLIAIILIDCKVPKSLTFFIVGNVIIFLYLFLKFYFNTYSKPKSADKKIEID